MIHPPPTPTRVPELAVFCQRVDAAWGDNTPVEGIADLAIVWCDHAAHAGPRMPTDREVRACVAAIERQPVGRRGIDIQAIDSGRYFQPNIYTPARQRAALRPYWEAIKDLGVSLAYCNPEDPNPAVVAHWAKKGIARTRAFVPAEAADYLRECLADFIAGGVRVAASDITVASDFPAYHVQAIAGGRAVDNDGTSCLYFGAGHVSDTPQKVIAHEATNAGRIEAFKAVGVGADKLVPILSTWRVGVPEGEASMQRAVHLLRRSGVRRAVLWCNAGLGRMEVNRQRTLIGKWATEIITGAA